MKVSIVIPTKNRLEYLKESVKSAQDQSYSNIEIVLSDDGSEDGTLEFIKSEARRDLRVRLAPRNAIPGAFSNIRHLINNAKGEAIAILGDDDILEANFVEALVAGLSDAEVDIAYCMHDIIDGSGVRNDKKTAFLWKTHAYARTRSGKLVDSLIPALLGQMWLGSCLFRTSAIRDTIFRTESGAAADLDIAIELATKAKVYFVRQVLWHYRNHPATISRSREIESRKAAPRVLERYCFSDPTIECLRLTVLRKRLSGLAWFSLQESPDAAKEVLRRYRNEGGKILAVRFLVVSVAATLPARVTRSIYALGNKIRTAAFPGQY